MKIEKIYSIKKGEWTKWADTVADAVRDFYNVYTFYPNILEANNYTFSQFDFLTNVVPSERQRAVRHDDAEEIKGLPDETENIRLCSFSFRNTADIDFAVDNKLADKEFRLVYDDEPEWDNPEITIDCPENELETVCKGC